MMPFTEIAIGFEPADEDDNGEGLYMLALLLNVYFLIVTTPLATG